MIGHYVNNLTSEQENRVLTQAMGPGTYERPCLVGAALGPIMANATRNNAGLHLRVWKWPRSSPAQDSVERRFDIACERFGDRRIGAAIRNRILANRARRVLAGVLEAVTA